MPRTHNIDAGEMFDPVMIKLFDGTEYRLREAVRSVEGKVKAKQDEINALVDRTAPLEKELTGLRRQILGLREVDPASPQIERLEEDIEAKQKEIEKKSTTVDDALPYLIEMLDILLEPKTPKLDPETGDPMMAPAEVNKDGKPKQGTEMIPVFISASESIQGSLDDDKIGTTHVEALSKKLNETAMEARPT
jgi:hypothetical protein